LKAPPMGD